MSKNSRPGYFQDKNGEWHADQRHENERRTPRERRETHPDSFDRERRNYNRRATDEALQDREHQEMMDSALVDFAKEHENPIDEQAEEEV